MKFLEELLFQHYSANNFGNLIDSRRPGISERVEANEGLFAEIHRSEKQAKLSDKNSMDSSLHNLRNENQ